MDLFTGLLALLLNYVGQDRCSCDDAGTCLCCLASRALDEAEAVHPAPFAEANTLSGLALRQRFDQPVSATAGGEPLPTTSTTLPARP